MARYRVGEGGIRVTTKHVVVYTLPPGTVLDEIPEQYEGKLIAEVVDTIDLRTVSGYSDKRVRPTEDKSL